MGRTVPTYRQALETRLRRWQAFGRLLTSPEDREAFQRIETAARRYIAQATYVGSPDLLESILLSVLLDLARRIPGNGTGTPKTLADPTAR